MKRIIGLLVAVTAVSLPSVAGAGGWAVGSLDPLPPLTAGEEVDIGFTVLQHGVTPVDAAEWKGAAIGLGVRADGVKGEQFAPARSSGEPGHFVATVAVPHDATSLSLSTEMRDGLFMEEQWVDVAVGAASASAGAAGNDGWLPNWTIVLFAVSAFGCAAVLIIDALSGRRRPDGNDDRANEVQVVT